MGGNAVQLVEGSHHAQGAGVHGGLVGRQVELPQPALAHVHGVVIAAGLGRAVGGEMLHAGQQGAVGPQVTPLVAARHGGRDEAAQVRVFPGAF